LSTYEGEQCGVCFLIGRKKNGPLLRRSENV